MKIWAPVVLTASLTVSGFGTAHAQKHVSAAPAPPPSVAGTAKPDYTRESTIFDQLTRTYTYAADGTGSRDISGIVEIRDQAAIKALSVIPVAFASNSEHVEIDYVRVRHADGTIVPTPATDAQELPAEVTREAPFYSDLKEEQIPVRGLQIGDHLEYHLRIIRSKAEAPGHFWGSDSFFLPSSGFVVLSEIVELHVPKATYVQVWSPNYKPAVTDTADERVYRWHSAQLQPVAGKEKNQLLLMDSNPTLGTSDDPKLPHIAWTSFHTWAEVGAWYRGLEGARTQPDDDVRSRVSTLIAGKSTEEEKTRAIYGFVGPQIRYIGVAFGIGRYQPHDAGDILRNQYGDCKDKATLLTSMLSSAGISTDTALIGAGVAFNEAVPSPGSFNHAINLVHVDGKPVWLDSTAEVAPYRLLISFLRGKQALVIPLTGEAHLETTPKDPPFPQEIHFDSTGTLDDTGTSHSRITMDLRGDTELIYRAAVRMVSPAQWDDLMQRISYSMSYAGKVTNATFSRPDDTAAPFHIAYDYQRDKSGDWDNLRILPQLPPLGLSDVDEKNPPVTPIELGEPQTETAHAVMKLPKNWVADLPPAVHVKAPFATYDKTYTFENGTVTTDLRYVVLQEKIPASDWRAYHKWFTDAGLSSETFIQLTNTPFPGSDSASKSSATSPNSIAADLIRQAGQAEQRQDWATARTRLDAAKDANPNQAYLWSNYGFIAMKTGDLTGAISDYEKELAAYPNESNVSQLLAATLMRQKKPEEAIVVLQSAVDRDPAYESNVLYLASILSKRSNNAAAEKVLRIGVAAKPDSLNLQMQLGLALLRETKTAEGEAILLSVLSKADDPGHLNDAAYELADANLDLPLAEKSSLRSLDLLDTATNNGETGPVAVRRANLLLSSWDTYGWILYREGKTAEAETWIRAAWRNSDTAEPGYHLAILLEKQNHPTEALAQLDLAQSCESSADSPAVAGLISTERSRLLNLGSPLPAANAGTKLQNDRTYALPRGDLKPTGEGWATVELELTPQATAAFRIVQGDQSLQPLSNAIQHLNLDLQLPPQSHARLLRRGVVSCHTGSACQLVLIPQNAQNP